MVQIKIKRFSIFFILLLILTGKIAFAEDINYKVWSEFNNVKEDKSWKISFNKVLNKNTLKDNITVIEKESKKNVDFKLEYNEKNKYLFIKPYENYKYGKEYFIIIHSNIKSIEGRKLLKGVLCYFTIQNKDKKNVNLIKESFKNPGNIVNSKEEFYNVLRYALSEFKPKIVLTINKYNSSDYGLKVINDILKDNPILDYGYRGARGNISGLTSTKKATMTINFRYDYSMEKMKNMKKASQEITKEIIKKIIKSEMTDYEKEVAIHDYIINNAKYDNRIYTGDMPNESYSDYGVLIKGVGVCDSYARAMYRLLNSIGIETLYVVGEVFDDDTITPHAWNMVKIDGEYYQVDSTFDDPVTNIEDGILSHDYFNLTDDELKETHKWDKYKYPKCNATKYAFNDM